MTRPRLLDLFCGAGGAAMGYYRAGFDVVGVDIKPQKHYPFPFILGDALDVVARMLRGEKFLASDGKWYSIEDFDAIHASPPCQGYSITKSIHARTDHPLLIEDVRKTLLDLDRPFVIENVEGAPLINPLMLCGTMFGLRVRRHRLFEANPPIYFAPFSCNHWGRTLSNSARIKQRRVVQSFSLADFITVVGHDFSISDARIAMGIDWMNRKDLAQSIPPAYTEYIGGYLLKAIQP